MTTSRMAQASSLPTISDNSTWLTQHLGARTLRTMRLYVLLFAALVSSSASAVLAQAAATYNLGCSSGECIVHDFDAPSEAQEFLQLGRRIGTPPVAMSLWRRMQFRSALRAFPDAASCLKDGEGAQGHDLVQFDWDRIRNAARMEVCLFRVHAVMPNADVSRKWFEAVGFRTLVVTNAEGHFRAGWTTVHATWVSGKPFPGRIGGFSSAVQRNAEQRVINVSVDFSRK